MCKRIGSLVGGALGRLVERAARWAFDPPSTSFSFAVVYDGTAPAETYVIGPGRPPRA